MKKLSQLILGSAFSAIAFGAVLNRVNASPNAGFHLNVDKIRDGFHTHLVKYVGECPGKDWSGNGVANIRFISHQTTPRKNLKVRLTNLVSGKQIKRDYKKVDKGSNDFRFRQLGNADGTHEVEYEIYDRKTEEILETGNFNYNLTSSEEIKLRDGKWKLELFCATNKETPIEKCDFVGQREVKYCQGRKTSDVRNERIVRRKYYYFY